VSPIWQTPDHSNPLQYYIGIELRKEKGKRKRKEKRKEKGNDIPGFFSIFLFSVIQE